MLNPRERREWIVHHGQFARFPAADWELSFGETPPEISIWWFIARENLGAMPKSKTDLNGRSAAMGETQGAAFNKSAAMSC